MTLEEYRKNLTRRFEENHFESAGTEADYIASEVLSIPHIELVLYPERIITDAEYEKMESFAARRLKNEPFQYIFGWTPFREIDLSVAPGVLIPRPETEAMVDLVLKNLPLRGTLCELGIGSGAISLSVAYERRDVKVAGSEISLKALEIAEENRKKLSLENVQFFQGDLYSPFAGKSFDVIVANLPYIPWKEEKNLPPNVRDYEPREALFADDEGFAIIERAILDSPLYLKKDSSGAIIFELGGEQGCRAVETAEKTGFFTECRIEEDIFHVPRFLYAVHKK
ncbi:MAG: peptide chain release factor N(5)-glutamine methyltransferase [Lentisphaeria bacterium]|nr:peptide chain release factor N(5)-glutamine methyltransferase [Lentisphaeria bacterium]